MLMIHPVSHISGQSIQLPAAASAALPCRPKIAQDSIAGRFDRAPIRTLKPHEPLFRDGDEKTSTYQILEGAFVLYRLLPNGRRQVMGFAVRGDLVGLGVGDTHRCSAEASGPAKVRALPASALCRAAAEDAKLALQLYEAISNELATAQDLLMALGRLNASERVATFLLGLANRADAAERSGLRIDLPMTRSDIADFLGLTTETVSRTLTKLANASIISRHPGSIRILDAAALEEIADGDRCL